MALQKPKHSSQNWKTLLLCRGHGRFTIENLIDNFPLPINFKEVHKINEGKGGILYFQPCVGRMPRNSDVRYFVVRFCLGLDASIPEKKSRAFTSLYPSLVMYFIVAVS